MSGFSPAAGGGFDVGFSGLESTSQLDPGKGYWINTYKDNLAMIILHP